MNFIVRNILYLSINVSILVRVQYIFNPDTMKVNCNFDHFFNNSDINPAVLDGGNKIILIN